MQDKIYIKLEGPSIDIREVQQKVDAVMRVKLEIEFPGILETSCGYRTIYERSINMKPGYLAVAKKISDEEFLIYVFSKTDGIKYTYSPEQRREYEWIAYYEVIDRKATVSIEDSSNTVAYKMLNRITLVDAREFFL
ncbi:MAG TPA: hypothetical protein P5539_08945 [Mesotoga sp.]|nr:hypothetical protein [Mesotoga sp.]